jgi:Stage II sporulation protein E (SpoIIE)
MDVGRWYEALGDIVNRTHLSTGDDLAWIVAAAVDRLGMAAELYLADLPQQRLEPVRADLVEPLTINATLAGRAYRLVEILSAPDPATGRPALWVPLLDGTQRIGVVHLLLPAGADPDDTELRGHCWTLTSLVGHIAATKLPYDDVLHRLRRPVPLSTASEVLRQLLPPQTFACRDLTVSALIEHYDQAGGDAYDYSVDRETARFAIFDATGHDIHAGLICNLALGATRNAAREQATLLSSARLADELIREYAPGHRFATAVLAELRLDTGVLSYLNAGHPPPVLLRGGKAVKTLGEGRCLPLGLQHLGRGSVTVGREHLQPGDRLLLYTDGVVEARNADGEEFGLQHLTDLTEHHCAAGLPAPETLRRITHAMLDHQQDRLQDDASLLLLEWPTPANPNLLPSP